MEDLGTEPRRERDFPESKRSASGQGKVHLYSELYCRLNGFMLGVFAEMCNFGLAKERYPFYRNRIQTFLDEIGINTKVPIHFEEYKEWGGNIKSFAFDIRKRSPVLLDFLMLGVFATTYIRLVKRNRPQAEICRRLAHGILTRNQLDFELFDRLVKPEDKPAKSIDEMLSPALSMLVGILGPVKPEPQTCFIAMPFKEPFERRYPAFYRPILAETNYRSLRTWGGFGQEDFSPLLVTLIMKSGALLADITNANPNVIWELGVAQGSGKTVFLLCEEDSRPPADLLKHATAAYRPHGKTWLAEALKLFPLLLSMQASALEKLKRDPMRIASGLRQSEIEGVASFLKDTFWEASFLSLRNKGENDANEHIKRGLERAKESRLIEADADFTYALNHGGLEPAALFGRGLTRLQMERYAPAETDFNSAIGKGLEDPEVYKFRAIARSNQRKWQQARMDIDHYLTTRPKSLDALHLRAQVCAQLGDTAVLEQDCRDATSLAPKHPRTKAALGFLHMLREEFSEAATCFREARAKSFSKSWHFQAGLCELLAGNFESALREYEKGLLHATDENIDDGLFDLSFWRRKFPTSDRAQNKTAARIRRRLLEVRTPRSWGRAARQRREAESTGRKSSKTRVTAH